MWKIFFSNFSRVFVKFRKIWQNFRGLISQNQIHKIFRKFFCDLNTQWTMTSYIMEKIGTVKLEKKLHRWKNRCFCSFLHVLWIKIFWQWEFLSQSYILLFRSWMTFYAIFRKIYGFDFENEQQTFTVFSKKIFACCSEISQRPPAQIFVIFEMCSPCSRLVPIKFLCVKIYFWARTSKKTKNRC